MSTDNEVLNRQVALDNAREELDDARGTLAAARQVLDDARQLNDRHGIAAAMRRIAATKAAQPGRSEPT